MQNHYLIEGQTTAGCLGSLQRKIGPVFIYWNSNVRMYEFYRVTPPTSLHFGLSVLEYLDSKVDFNIHQNARDLKIWFTAKGWV